MGKRNFLENVEDSNLLYIKEAKVDKTETSPVHQAGIEEKFNFIGKYTSRIDGRKIVTGQAPYTHDMKLKGMLYGKILRSPHARAEIVSIDLSAAQKFPGVKAVMQLKEGQVFYAGEQVAALAALDENTAEIALLKIRVDYKVLPFAVSEKKAQEEGAPQIHEERPNVQQFNDYQRGDIDAGFKAANAVIKGTYKTSVEIHQNAETHSSIALWKGDNLTVWDSTQAIHNVRDGLARVLKIPASRIRVIKQYMGGGFGSKLGLNDYTVTAAKLAKIAGNPVKIVLSRKDSSLCVGNRPSSIQTYKGGVKKDGTLTALSLETLTCGGIGRGDRCAEPLVDVYKCPNVKVLEHTVYTNTGASRPMRAPGHTPGTFGLESFLDLLAHKIGMDPLELRRKNYSTKNQGDTGDPYSSKGLDKCYQLGAEKIGWERRNSKPGEGKGKVHRGIGMASQIWWGGGSPGTQADIKLHPDGSVEAICGTQDNGCGTRTFMAVVAADTLGLKPEEITVKIGNTDYPWAPISGGSLTVPSVAPAVRDAALKAAARLKQVAAGKLKIDVSEVVLKDHKLSNKNQPENSLPIKEVFRALRRETIFHGERKGFPPGYAYNTFGAHFAEVEVDTETGKIKVLRVVAAHEVGRIINRKTAESQVIGGVIQGLSATLFEERILDDFTGNMVNPNLRDYKIATPQDIPERTPIFVDSVDPLINNLGTKGLGEPTRIPISGAINNAVFNAIGIHIRELPMTPDKVLQAVKSREAGQ